MTFGEVATVGVVGLGDTGLPLALSLAGSGLLTTGLDADRAKVDALRVGRSYLPGVSAEDLVATADWFEPTGDPSRLAGLDAYVICVPAPLQAADLLGPLLRAGSVVEARSPVSVPRLAARLAAGSGLRPGVDFHITEPGAAAA